MSIAYLGRANPIRLQLLQDGAVVKANTVYSAALHVPAQAFATGVGVTYNTSGQMMSLEDGNTVVAIRLGTAPLKPGNYVCLLTIYDALSPDGLAWQEVPIQVRQWTV